jgi:phosphohistidine phosphatase
MARRLQKAGIRVDRLLSSPARRARHTAELFARELGSSEKDIDILTELYHAQASTFQQVIAALSDEYDCVALFSHNPGITIFVNTLGGAKVDNMPTCSVFAVKSGAATWSEFLSAGAEFLFFDYPKSATAD